jgi:cell division protein FtsL
MNNRLNYSSIDDAWGQNNTILNDKPQPIQQTQENWKNVNTTLSISSNEISELKDEIKKLKETEHFHQETLKPCSLVNDHVKKCNICRNNMMKELQNYEQFSNTSVPNIPNNNRERINNNRERINNYRKKQIEQYNDLEENQEEDNLEEDNQEQESNYILETFENITPSQKNLLLVIIYGILIIVISDLIIKDTK